MPLNALADVVRQGLRSVPLSGVRPLLEALFGGRFQKRHFEPNLVHDAYALASADKKDGVAFTGSIHPDNPPIWAIRRNQSRLVPYHGTRQPDRVWSRDTLHAHTVGLWPSGAMHTAAGGTTSRRLVTE